MRNILLTIGLLTLSQPGLSNEDNQLGLLAATRTSFYKGTDSEQYLFPLLIYEIDRFYLHGTQAGYRFLDTEKGSLALEVRRTFDGYQASDSSALDGMDDRDAAWEAGLAFERALAGGDLKAKLMQDISHTHEGFSARLEYERPCWSTATTMVSWYGGAEYFDGTKSDYYFGVTEAEARSERPEYHPGSIYRFFGGSTAIRHLSPHFDLLASLEYMSLDSGANQSAIVSRSDQVSAYAGIIYHF